MTTTLSIVLAETPIAELKAVRTLLHRAGDRARRGWTYAPDRRPARELPYAPILAAVCVEICAELDRRAPGDPFSGCPSCESERGT